jgi:tyrosinase
MATSTVRSEIDLRVRRNVDDLSGLDFARLRRGFQAMMDVADNSGYQYWAGIHGMPLPIYGRHNELGFLPWNRIYLARFEEALRGFEPGIVLPWWDWTKGVVPEDFSAPEVDGRPNPLAAAPIEAGESSGGEQPTVTSRQDGFDSGNPFLPSREMVDEVLELSSFEAFSERLERINNMLHAAIGGTNGSLAYSSYDPFYWVYMGSIDRLWWLWQGMHPDVLPPEAVRQQRLAPFVVTVADVWTAERLGYVYADPHPKTLAKLVGGAGSDRPSVADQLNFSEYAQAFAEIIASEDTTAPLTIGIYGSWGIGKSSLLEMIAGQFEDPDAGTTPVHVLEFNAWEYNSSEKIWPALVRRVMEEMEQRAQWTRKARLWDTFGRNLDREWRRRRAPLVVGFVSVLVVAFVAAVELNLSPALIFTALAALGISGAAKLISDVATNPVSKWVATLVEHEDYGEELPYMREIRDDLRFLARQMCKDGEQPRILVMIDDLDRCEPEKAVEVLQAVNQLLDFDAFVVCLGIDARVITAAVEAHYNQLLGETGASGYEYLDKIVQIPFRIPTPTPTEVENFLSAQMPIRTEIPEVEVTVPASETEADSDFDGGEGGEAGAATEVDAPKPEEPPLMTTQFQQSEVEGFRELAPFIRSNPRHIKRLVNVYRLVRTLAIRKNVLEILDNSAETIAWIVISSQWPYSVSGMLRAFKPYIEAVDAGGDYPEGSSLLVLHDASEAGLDPELRRKVDGDPDDLRRLLEKTEISWKLLRVLRTYTLNFNPAIEEARYRGRKIPTPSQVPEAPGEETERT